MQHGKRIACGNGITDFQRQLDADTEINQRFLGLTACTKQHGGHADFFGLDALHITCGCCLDFDKAAG
ncbi:hypothetical protein D3C84_1190880 [compost metagenome]